MKERPVLFSGEMVRAILDGKKTQTRRVIKHPERLDGLMLAGEEAEWCPYGQPGDRLWVRETWNAVPESEDSAFPASVAYTTGHCIVMDGQGNWLDQDFLTVDGEKEMKWRPSIHMPRWASRLTLEIVSVRVERLQDISPQDACAEGIEEDVALVCYPGTQQQIYDACAKIAVERFRVLWDSINAKRGYPWASNPWVWVIEFKRIGA